MIYSSSLFLLYFLPLVLVVYYLVDRKFKNGFLLLASLFFYAWGAPKFLFWVAGSVAVDFLLIRLMATREGRTRKLLFWGSVLLNLGLLAWFKYMNFFADQFNALLAIFGSKPAEWTRIALPVGISFITFQKLAYTFDVHKRQQEPFRNFFNYALYIFMFPQLLSGPIVRPGQIAGQIRGRAEQESTDDRLTGFFRFIIGLSKKVLIADVLGATVNEIFSLPATSLSTGMAWIGAVAYTFQIYYDFSGYSDMAIGLARMLGFRLPENFNFPYVSQSITEFWRRWHMTLSFWFRDYLFLPLAYAVSRKMPKERYFDVRADKIIYLIATTVTFLLCGFWHGAAWTFVAWGAYMGLFLIVDRLFLLKYLKKAGRVPSIVLTFFLLVIGWLIFRAATLDEAWFLIRRLFQFRGGENDIWLNPKFWTMLVFGALFAFSGAVKRVDAWVARLYDRPANMLIIVFTIMALAFFVLDVATVSSSGFSPFIYFRF